MNEQSNTRFGAFEVIAKDALTGLEGYLVMLVNDGGVLKAALPDAVTDLALHVIVEGAAAGSYATVQPLAHAQEVRIKSNGVIACGARVKLATPNGTDDGKIVTIGTSAGVYFSPGICKEVVADEQLALIQPDPQVVNIESAHIADPASAAALTQEAVTDSTGGSVSTTLAAATNTDSLTDSSGGAANTTIAAITNSANAGSADVGPVADGFADVAAQLAKQRSLNTVLINAIASIAAQLAKIKTDVAALRTGSEANNTAIDSINAALAEQKVTAAS
jgi:hypothetical protein